MTGLPCEEDDEEVDTDDVEEECEDGVDAMTGLPCEDGDEEEECECGDEELELDEAAVPDSVPHDGIGTCLDDDDEENEQEGEHED